MESASSPASPTSPKSATSRMVVWRLSSSTGSVTTTSGNSVVGKAQAYSSGRGGSGNIRRHSLSGDGLSHASTHDSSAKSVVEEKKDDIIVPKGLELTVSGNIGIKSSGRGGSGNINGSRRLLQLFGDLKQPTSEELDAKEREVLAAHRAKKLAQASLAKSRGRGGLGNLSKSKKSKSRSSGTELSPRNRQLRRSASFASSRSSSSSVKRRRLQSSGVDSELYLTSIESMHSLFVRDSSEELPPVPSVPVASTSRLPPPRPAPTTPLPSIPSIDSPPSSPLQNLTPPIPNRPLNQYSSTATQPSTSNPPRKARVCLQRKSAGRGAEWRLVTQVREERRGPRLYIIEEVVWELYTREEIRREKQEAYEMKMMKKRITKGKGKIWGHSDAGAGYVSDPA